MDLDDLYGLPLDEFVPARNALARELRGSGKREEAGEVAALRKPSVAGWAVNQLVRTQRRAVDELFEAGDALRDAHDGVLAGRGDANSLRAGVERERAAVDVLTAAARGLLTSQGHELGATIIDRVADTLHAAALDEDARCQVEGGRLERELRHVGLGMAAAGGGRRAAGGPREGERPREGGGQRRAGAHPAVGDRRAGDEGAAEQRAERERAERERAEARAAARATEREARRRVERAERTHNGASERRDRAARALEDAEAELSDAAAELEEARDQLGTAEEALRELGR